MSEHTLIGAGAYGKVYTALKDGKRKAIKAHGDILRSLVEIDMMTRFRHPNIMPLEGILPGYTVMPCADMTLLDYVRKKRKSATLVEIFYEIVSAVEFLLKQDVLPFDLHTGNIVMMGDTPLLIDIALVRRLNRRYDTITSVEFPTEDSLIPIENLQGSKVYSEASIVWGLGSLAYTIFSRGRFMLNYETKHLSKRENMKAWILKHLSPDKTKETLNITFKESIPYPRLRELVVDLTAGMLVLDPRKRTSMEKILTHPLFNGYGRIQGYLPLTSPLPLLSDKKKIMSLAETMLSDLRVSHSSDPPSNIFFAALYIYEGLKEDINCTLLKELCALTITYSCYFLDLNPYLISHARKLIVEGDDPKHIMRCYINMVNEAAERLLKNTGGSIIPMPSYRRCLESLSTLFPGLKETPGAKEFLAQLVGA